MRYQKLNSNKTNELFRLYNKCIRRRNNLIQGNRNKRRQLILANQIERLYQKISGLNRSFQRGVAAAAIIGAGFLAPQQAAAQTTFSAIQSNPFSITPLSNPWYGAPKTNATFADLDNDGDLDMVSGMYFGSYHYYENTGSSTAPNFASPATNPFGLKYVSNYGGGFAYGSNHSMVDLDNDGDFDMVSGAGNGTFYYVENIGTASSPAFGSGVLFPFSLTSIGGDNNTCFVDFDNDGDLDLMAGAFDGKFHYFENTGTASAPNFAAQVINPYGLTDVGQLSAPSMVDLDNDGDLDLISGDTYSGLKYFENIGSASSPSFGPVQINPFIALSFPGRVSTPTFVDLDADGDSDIMVGEQNGSFKYFENTSSGGSKTSIKNLTAFGQESNVAVLYPNPVAEMINLDISSARISNVEIRIVDMLGRQVAAERHVSLQEGNNTIRIEARDLPAGSYLLTVQGDDLLINKKFNK